MWNWTGPHLHVPARAAPTRACPLSAGAIADFTVCRFAATAAAWHSNAANALGLMALAAKARRPRSDTPGCTLHGPSGTSLTRQPPATSQAARITRRPHSALEMRGLLFTAALLLAAGAVAAAGGSQEGLGRCLRLHRLPCCPAAPAWLVPGCVAAPGAAAATRAPIKQAGAVNVRAPPALGRRPAHVRLVTPLRAQALRPAAGRRRQGCEEGI